MASLCADVIDGKGLAACVVLATVNAEDCTCVVVPTNTLPFPKTDIFTPLGWLNATDDAEPVNASVVIDVLLPIAVMVLVSDPADVVNAI